MSKCCCSLIWTCFLNFYFCLLILTSLSTFDLTVILFVTELLLFSNILSFEMMFCCSYWCCEMHMCYNSNKSFHFFIFSRLTIICDQTVNDVMTLLYSVNSMSCYKTFNIIDYKYLHSMLSIVIFLLNVNKVYLIKIVLCDLLITLRTSFLFDTD